MKTYLFFDSRYNTDPDNSLVMDAFDKKSRKAAKAHIYNNWRDTPGVLVEEDENGRMNIVKIYY